MTDHDGDKVHFQYFRCPGWPGARSDLRCICGTAHYCGPFPHSCFGGATPHAVKQLFVDHGCLWALSVNRLIAIILEAPRKRPKKRQSLKHCRRARVARWRMIALRACRGGGIQQLKYPLPMQGVVAKSISCRFYRHPSEVLPPDSSYSPTADIDLRGAIYFR